MCLVSLILGTLTLQLRYFWGVPLHNSVLGSQCLGSCRCLWPDSNPRPQWCFSLLNQVDDFDYGSYGWVCIYSTMYPRELRSKVSEWTCPFFFFFEKNPANHSRTNREQLFFLMGGLRRVQLGGLFFTRLRLIFCRKVTSRVRLGMGGFIHGCRNGNVVQ